MICPYCKKAYSDDCDFCPFCGSKNSKSTNSFYRSKSVSSSNLSELIRIVDDSRLLPNDKVFLKDRINFGDIVTLEQLERDIFVCESANGTVDSSTMLDRSELIRVVDDSRLLPNDKVFLKNRINFGDIVTLEQLERDIFVCESANGTVDSSTMLDRSELIRVVDDSRLLPNDKVFLKDRINFGDIVTLEQLERDIFVCESANGTVDSSTMLSRSELIRVVDDSRLLPNDKVFLKDRINSGDIVTLEQLERDIFVCECANGTIR